ncbi:MAG: hypothetical protein EYC62_08445 [Alphaproteobacteria bacterium]|nr:MAG: hypothetical protein EYC62_08445 [Alphaproteobacteria bacterium]
MAVLLEKSYNPKGLNGKVQAKGVAYGRVMVTLETRYGPVRGIGKTHDEALRDAQRRKRELESVNDAEATVRFNRLVEERRLAILAGAAHGRREKVNVILHPPQQQRSPRDRVDSQNPNGRAHVRLQTTDGQVRMFVAKNYNAREIASIAVSTGVQNIRPAADGVTPQNGAGITNAALTLAVARGLVYTGGRAAA